VVLYVYGSILIHTNQTICIMTMFTNRVVRGIICIWINSDPYQPRERIHIMSKVFTNAVVATAIIAFTEALKIDGQANDVRNMAIQKLVDVMVVKRGTMATKDFLKGNAITNPARAAVKQLFDTLVEKGLLSVQTGKIYSTNFWIAFQDGVPFSPALSNQKSKAKKERGAQTGNGLSADKAVVTKAGKVETTDRAALSQTLTKAFEQSQILIKSGDSQLTLIASTLENLINELSAPF